MAEEATEEAKLFHTMSITKAAIGAYYQYHGFDKVDDIYKIKGLDTNVVEAANHVSKYTDNCWDFEKFRTAVESDENLLTYSINALKPCGTKEKNEDGTYPWEYNNLMYQILACLEQIDIVTHFARMVRSKVSALYSEKEDGKVYHYRKGESFRNSPRIDGGMKYGWKWEHTQSGIPLGPHGLYMTKDTAERFGKSVNVGIYEDERVPIPRDMWWGIGKDEFTHYHYGWFFTEKCAYAVGYVCQVIAIVPNGVVSQLYEEEWGDENPKFMDHENNKWKHPRWSFISNIEKFQNQCEERTHHYLNRLKQPPLGQRGASLIMPSGSGKSFYIDHQNHMDEFIDCDPLTWYTDAQPHYVNDQVVNCCPWNWDDHLKIICLQVDQVVALAKKRRFWIMGATWWAPEQINAIVILDETIHRKRLEMKEDKFAPDFYDKTIKGMLIPQLLKDSKQKHPNIPIFDTILECVTFIRANCGTPNVVYQINNKLKSDQPQIKF